MAATLVIPHNKDASIKQISKFWKISRGVAKYLHTIPDNKIYQVIGTLVFRASGCPDLLEPTLDSLDQLEFVRPDCLQVPSLCGLRAARRPNILSINALVWPGLW